MTVQPLCWNCFAIRDTEIQLYIADTLPEAWYQSAIALVFHLFDVGIDIGNSDRLNAAWSTIRKDDRRDGIYSFDSFDDLGHIQLLLETNAQDFQRLGYDWVLFLRSIEARLDRSVFQNLLLQCL